VTTVKYVQQARGLFMVAEVETAEKGVFDGRRLPPLNYTKQWIVGIAEWRAEFEAERTRVVPMKKKCGGVGKGYEDVAGAQDTGSSGEPKWKEAISDVLKNRSKRPIRCVTDLVDHMIIGSKAVYAGTPQEHTFLMFHDALSTWYEPEVPAHIKEKHPGFENHFIRPVGSTCTGTLYKDRPPGNSPENVRGLDSYGFADLEYAMSFNCALSWVCPYGDPRRIFNQGTPEQVWHLMEQTWTVVGAPSTTGSLRISLGGSVWSTRSSRQRGASWPTRTSELAAVCAACMERVKERRSFANVIENNTARGAPCPPPAQGCILDSDGCCGEAVVEGE
jgi:hypothetical protein